MKVKTGYIDRSETFDDFLAAEGLLRDAEEAAIKAIGADRLKTGMRRSKSLKTSE